MLPEPIIGEITMRSIVVLPLLLLATLVAFAQETDYAPGPRHASLTIFDEIDDPVERESFRAAWNAKEPRAKRDLADAFAERYARSIVLREAYELSARASAEIGDHPAALERAQRSLRLLPENPFLLVMTADLAAKQSAFDLADKSARDALRYLANADTPWPVTADAWPRVRDELRSTAYFVLGRVAAAWLMALSFLSFDPERPDRSRPIDACPHACPPLLAAVTKDRDLDRRTTRSPQGFRRLGNRLNSSSTCHARWCALSSAMASVGGLGRCRPYYPLPRHDEKAVSSAGDVRSG
jgi:tetratricopeptide (TPR) repeat protein